MTDSPESRAFASSVSFAALFQKNVERIADFQKITLDMYAHQAANFFDYWKRFSMPAVNPFSGHLADMTGQGIRYAMDINRKLVDLMVQQSARGIEFIRPAPIPVSSEAPVKAEEPEDQSMDVLITETDEHAAIATKMVDRIEEMMSQAPPIIPDAAMQQRSAGQVAQDEKDLLVSSQAGERRPPQAKRPNHGKQKNVW